MSIRRIAVASTFLVAAVVVSTGTAGAAPASPASGPWVGRFDQPQQGYAPAWTVLHDGTPQQAGLDPGPIDTALNQLNAWTQNDPTTGHPMYSGQVTLLAHDGVIVAKDAAGYALRYSDQQGDLLPAAQQIPMRTNTIFDLASLSKLFTCIVAMQQIQAGTLNVDATVAS
jgi:CubicO group peptidase (beta-lactamase class C family)